MIRDFRDLVVWRKAIEFARLVYQLTAHFPKEERFGLTSQVRRSAVSVSSNIAEGHARHGREFIHFLSIAQGSLAEAQSQLLLAVELELATADNVQPLLELSREIRRMICSLRDKLQSRHRPDTS